MRHRIQDYTINDLEHALESTTQTKFSDVEIEFELVNRKATTNEATNVVMLHNNR